LRGRFPRATFARLRQQRAVEFVVIRQLLTLSISKAQSPVGAGSGSQLLAAAAGFTAWPPIIRSRRPASSPPQPGWQQSPGSRRPYAPDLPSFHPGRSHSMSRSKFQVNGVKRCVHGSRRPAEIRSAPPLVLGPPSETPPALRSSLLVAVGITIHGSAPTSSQSSRTRNATGMSSIVVSHVENPGAAWPTGREQIVHCAAELGMARHQPQNSGAQFAQRLHHLVAEGCTVGRVAAVCSRSTSSRSTDRQLR